MSDDENVTVELEEVQQEDVGEGAPTAVDADADSVPPGVVNEPEKTAEEVSAAPEPEPEPEDAETEAVVEPVHQDEPVVVAQDAQEEETVEFETVSLSKETEVTNGDDHLVTDAIELDEVPLNPTSNTADISDEPLGMGCYLTFNRLSCHIKNKGYVLEDVSGFVKPRESLCILGASGAGKSTLLDILAHRKNMGFVQGDILVNGQAPDEHFRLRSGYMNTDTVFVPTMTVYETVKFAADCKLPNDMSSEDRVKKVDNILSALHLDVCKHTRVGDELTRGLSSGERKRLAVAVEVMCDPTMLFLDEPTSGLDTYGAAYTTELILKHSHSINQSVITVIHQPTEAMFELYDRVLLLHHGRLAYFGKTKEMESYFTSIGYATPNMRTPIENALEAIACHGEDVEKSWKDKKEESVHNAVAQNMGRQSILGQSFADTSKSVYSRPFPIEMGILLKRLFWRYVRNPTTSYGRFIVGIAIALLYGLLFRDITADLQGFRMRMVLSAFLGFLPAFMAIMALPQFLEDRELFYQERVVGTYRTISFYLSYFLIENIIMTLLTAVQVGMVYNLAGLPSDNRSAFIGMACCQSLVSVAVAQATATMSASTIMAFSLNAGINALSYFFSGAGAHVNHMPGYLRWIPKITFWHYSVKHMVYLAVWGVPFSCEGAMANLNGNTWHRLIGYLKEPVAAGAYETYGLYRQMGDFFSQESYAGMGPEVLAVERGLNEASSLFTLQSISSTSAFAYFTAAYPAFFGDISNYVSDASTATIGGLGAAYDSTANLPTSMQYAGLRLAWRMMEPFACKDMIPTDQSKCLIDSTQRLQTQYGLYEEDHGSEVYGIVIGFMFFFMFISFLGLQFCHFRKR